MTNKHNKHQSTTHDCEQASKSASGKLSIYQYIIHHTMIRDDDDDDDEEEEDNDGDSTTV